MHQVIAQAQGGSKAIRDIEVALMKESQVPLRCMIQSRCTHIHRSVIDHEMMFWDVGLALISSHNSHTSSMLFHRFQHLWFCRQLQALSVIADKPSPAVIEFPVIFSPVWFFINKPHILVDDRKGGLLCVIIGQQIPYCIIGSFIAKPYLKTIDNVGFFQRCPQLDVLLMICMILKSQPLVLRNLGMESWLSNLLVTDIEKDQKGFIWVATEAGLNCFDGRRFRTFYLISLSLRFNCLFLHILNFV